MRLMIFLTTWLFLGCASAQHTPVPDDIYSFKVEGLEGDTIDFSAFKGKKILIVNTASKCGYTPQYAGLEKLYQQYGDKLIIVGFPSNNFLFQEPGNNAEIAEFCEKNYGVSFPMAAKISVKGKKMAPLYKWLTDKSYNQYKNSSVKWNFQKYLLNESGELIAIFPPSTEPLSDEVVNAVTR